MLVVLHAHPDDESIFTSGTILRAKRAGWRVVLVVATDGDRGTRLSKGGDLGQHRKAETRAAGRILGIDEIVFLGYGDSGFGEDSKNSTDSLGAARREDVAFKVRSILISEKATALTSYDAFGIYGHVDHIAVHDIAELSIVGTSCELYEATVSRSGLRAMRTDLVSRGLEPAVWPVMLGDVLGVEDDEATLAVEVGQDMALKQAAIGAHGSQVLEASAFMGLPPGAFHRLIETEWFQPVRVRSGKFPEMVGVPIPVA